MSATPFSTGQQIFWDPGSRFEMPQMYPIVFAGPTDTFTGIVPFQTGIQSAWIDNRANAATATFQAQFNGQNVTYAFPAKSQGSILWFTPFRDATLPPPSITINFTGAGTVLLVLSNILLPQYTVGGL